MPNLYCTNNDCYKEGKKIKKVEYLIVHSPAVYPTIIRAQSGAGGGWYTRWNKPGVEKFAHGFIDDTGVSGTNMVMPTPSAMSCVSCLQRQSLPRCGITPWEDTRSCAKSTGWALTGSLGTARRMTRASPPITAILSRISGGLVRAWRSLGQT